MADERYIVELILKARDETRDAFQKVINDQEKFNETLQQAQKDHDATAKSVRNLEAVEKDRNTELARLNKLQKDNNNLSSDTIHQQVALTNATERYVKTIHDGTKSWEEKRAAYADMEAAANALAKAENKLRGAGADLADQDVENYRQRQLGIAQSRELALAANDEIRARQAVLDALEEEGKRRKQLKSINSEEYRASEERIQNIRKNNEELRISEEELQDAVSRGQKIRKEDVDQFEKDTKRLLDSKKKVVEIDKKLSDPQIRKDSVLRTRLEVDREGFIEEIGALERSLKGRAKIRQELELDVDEGSVARLKASERLLRKALSFKVPVGFEVDNGSLARSAGLIEVLTGAFNAFSEGSDKASKRVAAFDNIVRGLTVLGIAVFLQQLALSAVIAAGALAGLVSSAIAAGGALGGALTAGVAQALPALGIFAAFLNRFKSITQAVKQQNLQQQQASYQGGQAAQSQAKSLDQVVAAQERVKEAQDKVTEARKKAREALEDLILAEQKQALGLEKSREDLNKALTSGAGSFAVEQAQIGASESANQLRRTRASLRDRQRGGIEGSPEVKDAKKQLEDAQRALKQAQQASDQAGQSVSAAAGKLDYLVGNLSNAEKQLFDALVELQNRWRKFAQQITDPLTRSFTFAVKRVTKILQSDELIAVGRSTSRALGNAFREVFDAVLSPEYIGRIINIAKNFEGNLKPITQIAITLSRVFLDIAEAGVPAFRTILTYVNELVQKLGGFTSSQKGKNALAEFFDTGAQSLIKFVDLFLSVGNVILALIDPKGGGGITAGNTILDQLTTGFNNLAEAIRTPGTRANEFFKRFFAFGSQVLPLFKPLLLAVADLLDRLFTEKGLQSVKNFVTFLTTVVVPAFGFFLKTVTLLTDSIVKLIETFGPAKDLVQFVIGLALVGSVFGRILAVMSPLTKTISYFVALAGKSTIFGRMLSELTRLFPNLNRFKSIREKIAATEAEITAQKEAQAAADAADTGGDVGRKGAAKKGAGAADDAVAGAAGAAAGGGRFGKLKAGASKIPIVGRMFGGGAGGAAEGATGLARGGPWGLVIAAILAVIAAIGVLLTLGGKLDDVLNALDKVFKSTFKAGKDAVKDLIKELTGEKSIKKGINDIASFLAKVLIPTFRILGTIIGGSLVGAIRVVTAFVRYFRRSFQGIKEIFSGIFDLNPGRVIRGIATLVGALGELILNVLSAPFRGIADVARNVFKDTATGIESIFIAVINFFIRGINSILDVINRIPKVEIEKLKEVADPNDRRQSAARRARNKVDNSNYADQVRGRDGSQVSVIPKNYFDNKKNDNKNAAKEAKREARKATNDDAEKFLSSFNPETVKLSEEITKKIATYWRRLRQAAREASDTVRKEVTEMRGGVSRTMNRLVRDANSDLINLNQAFRKRFVNISNIVANQMQNASMAVYKGAKYMKDTLNDSLKSVGSDATIKLTLEPPSISGEKKASGGFIGRADGGWIGRRGERGRDMVPTMLGRGEAVLNWQQQKIVEPALHKTYGFGLDGMFGMTNSYHAGGPNNSPGFARGGGLFRRGRASWFGGPNDGMNTGTAIGLPDTAPGIALYNQGTLGKYFDVVSPQRRRARLRQIDIGPAPWTGKILDITSAALKYFGFNERNFPTGVGTWSVYGPFGGRGNAVNQTGGAQAQSLAMPIIKGGTEKMRELVSKGTKKIINAANKKLERETPTAAAGSVNISGPTSSTKGLIPQVLRAIAWARSHGWRGEVVSGFRTFAEQVALYARYLAGGNIAAKPGTSNHEFGRAIDVTDTPGFLRAMRTAPANAKLIWFGPGDSVHFSTDGRAKGGRIGGLKHYASGGHVDGPDGQAVPIMAHAGEWVLNRRQQNMVAGIAGTTADRLKGMLGFSGGPSSFAGGGVPRIPKSFRSSPFSIDAGSLPTITSSVAEFETLIGDVFKKINNQVKRLLKPSTITKKIAEVTKAIEELEKGKEDDEQKKQIEKLKKSLKDLQKRKDIATLLKSVQVLTGTDGTGGVLADYYNSIKLGFERTTRTFRGAAEGLKIVAGKLVSGKPTSEDIDPEKLALAEAKAQEALRDSLIGIRNRYQDVYDQLAASLKKFGSRETYESAIKRDTKSIENIKDRLERLKKGDEDDDQKKDIKRLEKKKKDLEDRLKKNKTNNLQRGKIQSDLDNVLKLIGEKDDEIIEAEKNRLEQEKTAFEENTKAALKATETNTAASTLRKSLAELGYALAGLGDPLTNVNNPVTAIRESLEATATEAKKKYDILSKRLEAAKALAAQDPRWQSIVDDLVGQVGDAALNVAQTQADVVSGVISAVDSQLSRAETTRSLRERTAALAERTLGVLNGNYENAVIGARKENLAAKGADITTALNELSKIDRSVLNPQQIDDLNKKIEDLTKQLAENAQDTQELTLQYRKALIESIQARTQRTTGRLGTLENILNNVNKALGIEDNSNRVRIAQATGDALQTERQSLIGSLTAALSKPEFAKTIADGGFGAEGMNLLTQILSSFQSGDPTSFANLLISLGPTIDALTATMGGPTADAFNSFIDSLVNNTLAVSDNTANLKDLLGLANQTQPFSTTSWTRFRAAIFNGIGDVLPQFQVPAMATGGYVTQGGLFQLHPGEFVINASQDNVPNNGDINITVNEANKPLDVTALASRIAFEKRTRK